MTFHVGVDEDWIEKKKRKQEQGKHAHRKMVVRPTKLRFLSMQAICPLNFDTNEALERDRANSQIHKIEEGEGSKFQSVLGPLRPAAKPSGKS